MWLATWASAGTSLSVGMNACAYLIGPGRYQSGPRGARGSRLRGGQVERDRAHGLRTDPVDRGHLADRREAVPRRAGVVARDQPRGPRRDDRVGERDGQADL